MSEVQYTLTFKDVVEILALVEKSTHCSELNVTVGEIEIRVTRDAATEKSAIQPDSAPTPSPSTTPTRAETALEGEDDAGVVVTPMAGTFYRAPSPGEAPFIEVGSSVRSGETIGLVEVMKLFTPITAKVSGKVREFLVVDGQAVNKGQPLLRIAVGDDAEHSGASQ